MEGKEHVAIGNESSYPDDLTTRLFASQAAIETLQQDINAAIELVDGREIELHYGGEPVLRPGIGREVWVTSAGVLPAEEVSLRVPRAWTCAEIRKGRFVLHSAGPVEDRNTVTVLVGKSGADFTILGPGEAKGFPAGDNVEKCMTCGARIDACLCKK
jgi:hypothetical protein